MIPYPNSATLIAKGVGMYEQTIVFHFADSSTLTLTNEDILGDTGVEIEDATSSQDTLQVGAAIVNKCSFTIANFNGNYDNTDFIGARFTVTIGIPIPNSTSDSALKGTFYVVEQTFTDSAISIVGYDAMHLFDKPYSLSSLTYPKQVGAIVADACSVCGVTLNSSSGLDGSMSIPTKPDGNSVTFREVISWIAQMQGKFARIGADGKLAFRWYDTNTLGNENAQPSAYHTIQSIYSKQVSKADVTITGIKINLDEETSQTVGTDDYMLEISGNEFITADNVSTVLSTLNTRLVGMTFRKIEVSHLSDPRIEAGDVFKLVVGNDHYWGDRKSVV